MNVEKTLHEPGSFQIEVTGRLGNQWSDWFEGIRMTISYKEGVTTISGIVMDKTALHGLLTRIRDLDYN